MRIAPLFSARSLLVGGFIALLFLPSVDMQLQLSPYYDETEKRALAPAPRLSLDELDGFPARFDDYFRDHFGFRSRLIRWYSFLQVKLFQRSTVPNVIIGERGWLFFAAYGYGSDIREFQGVQALSEARLDASLMQLEQRAALFKAHGVPYIVAIAPNKHSIYPEHLPARIGQRKPGNHLDQFMARARARASFALVDLRRALQVARRDGDVYSKTDTHWNARGAFAAYRAILECAQQLSPELRPRDAAEYAITRRPRKGGDLAEMLALHEYFDEVEEHYTLRATAAPSRPLTVALIGDSFAAALQPFFAQTFTRLRTYRPAQATPPRLLAQLVASKPDLVIDERVERALADIARE